MDAVERALAAGSYLAGRGPLATAILLARPDFLLEVQEERREAVAGLDGATEAPASWRYAAAGSPAASPGPTTTTSKVSARRSVVVRVLAVVRELGGTPVDLRLVQDAAADEEALE